MRHQAFAIVLLIGALVRGLATITYWPAFWFFDGARYINVSRNWVPDAQRPFGYSAILRLFDWTGSLATVTIAQHLLGLGIATGLYAFLRHRGVATWLAVLGAAPISLDAYQITIEHYILAETFFTAMLLGSLGLLLWRRQPSVGMMAGAGLLLALAGLTRTIGLSLVAIVLCYAVIRRMSWRHLVLFILAWSIPLAGYASWYHQEHGVYELGQYEGRFLYGRVTTFADCDQLTTLTAAQRKLCPAERLGKRELPSAYVWSKAKPQQQFPRVSDDPIFAGFARAAIVHQPLDYAYTVLTETLGYFGVRDYPICPGDWEMPDTKQVHCHPRMSGNHGFDTELASPAYREPGTLTAIMHSYQRYVYLPGMLWGVLIVVTVWAAVSGALQRRRRRGGGRVAKGCVASGPGSSAADNGADAVLLATLSLALLVLAVATSMFIYRYGVITLALLPPAGALAWHQSQSRLQWKVAEASDVVQRVRERQNV
ncbi:MAG: hypothetical protein DLM55_07040 [Acidimicrobiales bacterium]|nr:MAG: hypothetical protein DLM55_07040 [Acidimicrobiales bacterium]